MIEKLRYGIYEEGLKNLIADLPDNLVMAEIGCWIGESALLFLNSGKVDQFFAVDIWRRSIGEKYFDKNLKGRKITKLKMPMNKAISYLPSLDFVYIDGSHSYKWVKDDILSSLKVIKKGGIIAGHDYSSKYKDRVVKAVNEILGVPDKIYKDNSWLKYEKSIPDSKRI